MVENKGLRENSTSALEKDKVLQEAYRNMKGYILEDNTEEQGW